MTQNASDVDIRDWLRTQVASYVDLPPEEIAFDVPLAAYGVDSVYALTVIGDIEEYLQVVLDPELIWEHPTIEALATVLRMIVPQTSPGTAYP
jgi:acyl carrier protein